MLAPSLLRMSLSVRIDLENAIIAEIVMMGRLAVSHRAYQHLLRDALTRVRRDPDGHELPEGTKAFLRAHPSNPRVLGMLELGYNAQPTRSTRWRRTV